MSDKQKSSGGSLHKHMVVRLLVIVLAMFAFGYALVPIYEAVCEITGINVLTKQDKVKRAEDLLKNSQVDQSRTIKVVFDANDRGDWRFKPEFNSIDLHPGELATVRYEILNTMAKSAVGQAIPSYLPMKAAQHFNKMECFCFDQQAFNPGEKREFPVVFVLDPDLPDDVHTVTLSYTFFEVAGATAQLDESIR
ncbi:MAG: cytochrome c oxidase assembly protein [Limnobacter sp.]|nr:cytochrome c oxidase assembly protein [Limnobacter sp.]